MAGQLSKEERLLLENVFIFARLGEANNLLATLSSLSPAAVEEVLCHPTHTQEQGGHGRGTPLTIAAEEGHLEVVRVLVENFNVDLDQRVATDEFSRTTVTALMCASRRGHLDVVKLLVTKGCDVNLETELKRTAVLLACEGNHLEVVKFLVESGARMDGDAGKGGRSCLMASCHEGGEALIQCLLDKGADINEASGYGFTALHYAASNNCAKVVEVLMKNGATMFYNGQGKSPLAEAAIRRCRDVVSFFVQSSYVGRKEKIDSLELLGAMMAEDDTAAAFEYLHQAMQLRHENPNHVIPKLHSVLPEPSGFMESRTLEELEARGLDPDQLRLECLAIALRILGPTSLDAAYCFLAYIAQLVRAGRFYEALSNSVYFLHITEMFQNVQLFNNLFVFHICCAFSGIMENGQSPRFTSVGRVLELSLDILQQSQPASAESSVSSACFADLCLLCISVGLQVAKDPEEARLLRKLTESLVHLPPRVFRSGSVLHAAVSKHWERVRHHIPVESLHVDSLVSFLLQCGADVNAVDSKRNRPLHVLARCPRAYFDTGTLRNLTRALVEAGAPVSVLNRKGKTPLDLAVTEEMADILREFYPVPLLSLAASAVVRHRVPYTGRVPDIIEEFLQRH